MPFRQLPATDATRSKAINAALNKHTNTSAPSLLLSSVTAAALQTFQSQWALETTERADALSHQTSTTAELDGIGVNLRMHVSHFFQVFHFGVTRGVYSLSGRAIYQLSVNEESIPNLAAEADLLQWTGRIVEGDPRRVTNLGESAMANPSAAEVAAILTDYNQQLALQSTAKDALEGEQTDVNDLRPAADQLIRDIWDEVEFALRQLDAPTLRRRAREWGVFYALRPGEPEEPAETPPAV
jgi:hypothetical protein